MNEFDAQIRREIDRRTRTPQEVAAEAIAARDRAADGGELRERLAREAGLPQQFAELLQGEDAGELAAHAKELAEAVGGMAADPDPEPSFDDHIRVAMGGAPEQASPEEPTVVDMDGGARESTSPPEPTFDAVLRGTDLERRERRGHLAQQFD
mgnify:CR=1 FL=1